MCLCVGMCVFVCLSINMTMWVGVYKLHEKKGDVWSSEWTFKTL